MKLSSIDNNCFVLNVFKRFRWVICQLDVLRKCITVESLRRTLKALPKSLDETYERILSNIDEQHSDQALKVLQWLAFSACPVTLAEVAEGLTVNLDHGCMHEPDAHLRDPNDIVIICSSLVTISSIVNSSDQGTDNDKGMHNEAITTHHGC